MRMTDSPDSACEADNGNTTVLQQVEVSPFVPPPPPPINGFVVLNTGWTQLIDSDGDSGIMRLGSTSSSETDHSSSGFPDNYLSKLQVKHFTWIPPKPSTPLNSFQTPVRADHAITIAVPNHQNPTAVHSHLKHQSIIPSQRQKSMSVVDVRQIPNCNAPSTKTPTSARPLSLVGYPVDNYQQNQAIRCSCHTACIHCGAKFGWRNYLRSTSDIPGLCTTPTKCESRTNNPSMSVYEKLVRKEEVFSGYDMIKVHARPVSVIPEPTTRRSVTPRQAKSADAASRQRRLQKAFSMTCALDSDEFVKAHASIASVIPNGNLKYANIQHRNSNPMLSSVYGRPVTPLIPHKLANQVLPVSVNGKVLNQLRKEELRDECPPPPSNPQSTVTYAKVNKSSKQSRKGIRGCSELLMDDNEPPLPPRNYRSDKVSSIAGKMQGFTKSAKEVFRKAFGLDSNNEDHRSGRKNEKRHKTKDTMDLSSDNYVDI